LCIIYQFNTNEVKQHEENCTAN